MAAGHHGQIFLRLAFIAASYFFPAFMFIPAVLDAALITAFVFILTAVPGKFRVNVFTLVNFTWAVSVPKAWANFIFTSSEARQLAYYSCRQVFGSRVLASSALFLASTSVLMQKYCRWRLTTVSRIRMLAPFSDSVVKKLSRLFP